MLKKLIVYCAGTIFILLSVAILIYSWPGKLDDRINLNNYNELKLSIYISHFEDGLPDPFLESVYIDSEKSGELIDMLSDISLCQKLSSLFNPQLSYNQTYIRITGNESDVIYLCDTGSSLIMKRTGNSSYWSLSKDWYQDLFNFVIIQFEEAGYQMDKYL